MDISTISTVISGAKNLYDLINALFTEARKSGETEFSQGMRNSLLGEASKAQEASAKLSQMLGKRAVPFILRVGNHFRLPADVTKMEQAILKRDIWDWTYVFGFGPETTSAETVSYLTRLYCDPLDQTNVRGDAETTCLYLFDESLPQQQFGRSVYIAGVALTSSIYDQIFNIPKEDLLPNVVIMIDDDIRAFTDLIAMSFLLHKIVDIVFEAFSHRVAHKGFLFNDRPQEGERKLNHDILAALQIA